MTYVIVKNDVFIKRADDVNIEWDATHFCPAQALTDAEKAQFGVFDFAYAALAATLNNGFTRNAVLWHCDETFQSQVQGYVLAYTAGVLPDTATVPIRAKDNTTHLMPKADLIAFAGALLAYVQAAYAICWATKDALP